MLHESCSLPSLFTSDVERSTALSMGQFLSLSGVIGSASTDVVLGLIEFSWKYVGHMRLWALKDDDATRQVIAREILAIFRELDAGSPMGAAMMPGDRPFHWKARHERLGHEPRQHLRVEQLSGAGFSHETALRASRPRDDQ